MDRLHVKLPWGEVPPRDGKSSQSSGQESACSLHSYQERLDTSSPLPAVTQPATLDACSLEPLPGSLSPQTVLPVHPGGSALPTAGSGSDRGGPRDTLPRALCPTSQCQLPAFTAGMPSEAWAPRAMPVLTRFQGREVWTRGWGVTLVWLVPSCGSRAEVRFSEPRCLLCLHNLRPRRVL